MKFLSLELFSSQTNKHTMPTNDVGPLGFRMATDLWSDLFAKRFFSTKSNEDGGKNSSSEGNGAMEDEVARGR